MKHLIDFSDYRHYLKFKLTLVDGSRGMVSKLADFLECQPSYLSQVLGERTHLSLEHAEGSTRFFQLTEQEADFFMNLVHENRAGSVSLKRYYRVKMNQTAQSMRTVKTQIDARSDVSAAFQNIYYSQWWYAAAHILSALPGYNSRLLISEKLHLPLNLVNEIVTFLIRAKLVKDTSSGLKIGSERIHLGNDSALISRHHVNWRLKACDLIARGDSRDLNYSSVIGISESDGEKVRSMLLEFLKNTERILTHSKEEHPYMLNIDFNRVR